MFEKVCKSAYFILTWDERWGVDSREVIKELIRDGWYEVTTVGSHKQFKHPAKRPGDGASSEKGDSDRNPEEHRETGRDQIEVIPVTTTEPTHGVHRISA